MSLARIDDAVAVLRGILTEARQAVRTKAASTPEIPPDLRARERQLKAALSQLRTWADAASHAYEQARMHTNPGPATPDPARGFMSRAEAIAAADADLRRIEAE